LFTSKTIQFFDKKLHLQTLPHCNTILAISMFSVELHEIPLTTSKNHAIYRIVETMRTIKNEGLSFVKTY